MTWGLTVWKYSVQSVQNRTVTMKINIDNQNDNVIQVKIMFTGLKEGTHLSLHSTSLSGHTICSFSFSVYNVGLSSILSVQVLWDVTVSCWVRSSQHLVGSECLCLQGLRSSWMACPLKMKAIL